jgi:hypothetical protein
MENDPFMSKKMATIFFALVCIALLGNCNFASADVRYGFSVSDNIYPNVYDQGELKCSGEKSIQDFQNIDSLCSSARILNRASNLMIDAKLRIDTTGWYQLIRESSAGSTSMQLIRENTSTICETSTTQCPSLMWLTAGDVYHLYLRHSPNSSTASPFLRVRWRPNIADTANPTATPAVWIPDANLSAKLADNTEISIPSGSEEPMNYLVAGAGLKGNSGSATIQMQLPTSPTPITDDDIMRDNVYVIWRHQLSTNPNITVNGIPMTGTWFESESFEMKNGWLWGRVPELAVSADGAGKINFSFTGLSSTWHREGIAVILPFRDIDKPLGQLKLRLGGGYMQYSGTAPITFDVESRDLARLHPFLIIGGGDTLIENNIRSNYLSYETGTESQPSGNSFFGPLKILIPENPASITNLDPANKDSWYPAFPRNGAQFDVLAKNDNFAGSGYGGALEHLPIPPAGTKWISFQMNSSNFPENKDSVLDPSKTPSNDSLTFVAAGLLTYSTAPPPPPPPNPKMIVCPGSSSSLRNNILPGFTEQYEALFWNDFTAGTTPDCLVDGGTEDLNVTDLANWSSTNTGVVTVGNAIPDKGKIKGESDGNAEVNVSYVDPVTTNTFSGTAHMTVPAPSPCTYRECGADNLYRCTEKTIMTYLPCATYTDTCTTIGQSCLNNDGWKESAPR